MSHRRLLLSSGRRHPPFAGWRSFAREPAGRYVAGGDEGEFEPGSRGRVLRNRIGLRSVREMAEAESLALHAAQTRLLSEVSPGHRFTADDIRAIHALWLGRIYGWAGRYRMTNLSTRDGYMFAAAGRIEDLMAELESGPLRRFTPCVPADRDRVAEALGVVHAELILVHPFREGNGRCARVLATLMAAQAGLPPLDFSGIRSGAPRRGYFAAIRAAMGRDYAPITAIFSRVIGRGGDPAGRTPPEAGG